MLGYTEWTWQQTDVDIWSVPPVAGEIKFTTRFGDKLLGGEGAADPFSNMVHRRAVILGAFFGRSDTDKDGEKTGREHRVATGTKHASTWRSS